MKITKDSFIPVINGCIFSPENIISNERIIYYLSNLKDDFCFSEYIFRQIIKISAKELGIKSGYDLYNYVYKDEKLKYTKNKYDFDNMTYKEACKLLLKNFESMQEFKLKLPFYKNILTITLYKISKLELKN